MGTLRPPENTGKGKEFTMFCLESFWLHAQIASLDTCYCRPRCSSRKLPCACMMLRLNVCSGSLRRPGVKSLGCVQTSFCLQNLYLVPSGSSSLTQGSSVDQLRSYCED